MIKNLRDAEVDLHCHSIFSDGSDRPEEMAIKAQARKLKGVSLTDHNSCDGFFEFMVACAARDIDMISGIEISCALNGLHIHLLGYGFNMNESSQNLIKNMLKPGLEGVNRRAELMLCQLHKEGVIKCVPGLEEVNREFKCPGPAVSIHHIFHYCSKRSGIPYKKLYGEFGRGKKFWIEPFKETMPAPEEAIGTIAAAGGVMVWAHPYKQLEKMDRAEFLALLDQLCEAGMYGIEAHYFKHDDELTGFFCETADERGLFKTAGSDYHGIYKPREIGMPGMNYEDFLRLKSEILKRRKKS